MQPCEICLVSPIKDELCFSTDGDDELDIFLPSFFLKDPPPPIPAFSKLPLFSQSEEAGDDVMIQCIVLGFSLDSELST